MVMGLIRLFHFVEFSSRCIKIGRPAAFLGSKVNVVSSSLESLGVTGRLWNVLIRSDDELLCTANHFMRVLMSIHEDDLQ